MMFGLEFMNTLDYPMTKPKIETEDLFTAKDIARVRAFLIKEQKNKSTMTGLPLTKPCVDHMHDQEQLVRAVINSPENIALGKIEGLYARYVGWWFKGTYQEFLRMVASYLDLGVDRRFRHNGWIKKVGTIFNSLNEGKKDKLLLELGRTEVKNSVERKKYFNTSELRRKKS